MEKEPLKANLQSMCVSVLLSERLATYFATWA